MPTKKIALKRNPLPVRPVTTLTRIAVRAQPDASLVALSREGYAAAFEEIVRRYRDPLVGFAVGIVGDRAEDVVQESLLRAQRGIAASRAEIALRPWLHAIVRNTALNDLRDSPRHAPLHEDLDGVPRPPEIVEQKAELAALVNALKDLPDQQRIALLERELAGRSHAEIARRLRVSPGAVRQLIFRARSMLRAGMGLVVPLPILRILLDASSASAAAPLGVTGKASAGAAIAGGGAAAKAGAILTIGVLAIGGGLTVRPWADGEAAAGPSAGGPNTHGSPSAITALTGRAFGLDVREGSTGSGDRDPQRRPDGGPRNERAATERSIEPGGSPTSGRPVGSEPDDEWQEDDAEETEGADDIEDDYVEEPEDDEESEEDDVDDFEPEDDEIDPEHED